MSTQTVIEAFDRIRFRITERAGDYSLATRMSMLEFSDILQWWLARGQVREFNTVYDGFQEKFPMLMEYLETELFRELGCAERSDLLAHLMAPA